MKAKRMLAVLSALLVAGALAPAAAETDDRFPTDERVMGTQAAMTFGESTEEAEIGHALGADLREASVSMPDAETVQFTIGVHNLPAPGGTPEAIRYTWDMSIDGVIAQIDGKFSNYSRGTCDPTSGQCDPQAGKMPRDPGERPFFFRGNLNALDLAATTFNAMEELAVIPADFDTSENTITVRVPVEVINLLDGVEFGACSRITPGTGIFGGMVETAPAAFLSSGAFPSDVVHGSNRNAFTAPPAADAEVDCAGNPIAAE